MSQIRIPFPCCNSGKKKEGKNYGLLLSLVAINKLIIKGQGSLKYVFKILVNKREKIGELKIEKLTHYKIEFLYLLYIHLYPLSF